MKVYKFGGASIDTPEQIKNVASIIARHAPDNKLLVVVSAMGNTTNKLEQIYENYYSKTGAKKALEQLQQLKEEHLRVCDEAFVGNAFKVFNVVENLFEKLEADLSTEALCEIYDEGYDQIVSYGELLSTHILAALLGEMQVPAYWLDARNYLHTDRNWRESNLDWAWTLRDIQNQLPGILGHKVIVTQGFMGRTVDGRTTTFGREGSDYSASIFAHCLEADSQTTWKDVEGVYNADPKRIPDAVRYDRISYNEAAEMTYYGATIIHPKTIKPLAQKNIPLYVRSFYKPEQPGTCICAEETPDIPPAIIFKRDQVLLSFSVKDYAFITERHLYNILNALEGQKVKINMMQNTAMTYSVVVDANERRISALIDILQSEFVVTKRPSMEIVTVKNTNETVDARVMQEVKSPVWQQRTEHNLQVVARDPEASPTNGS